MEDYYFYCAMETGSRQKVVYFTFQYFINSISLKVKKRYPFFLIQFSLNQENIG